jgi:hypothetical protein
MTPMSLFLNSAPSRTVILKEKNNLEHVNFNKEICDIHNIKIYKSATIAYFHQRIINSLKMFKSLWSFKAFGAR